MVTSVRDHDALLGYYTCGERSSHLIAAVYTPSFCPLCTGHCLTGHYTQTIAANGRQTLVGMERRT